VRERTGQLFIVSRGPLVAGAYGPGMLSLYDGATGRLRWQARLGTYPTAIAFDEPTAHVFVSNFLSDDVSILDARTGALVHTTRLGPRPGTLAALCLDPRARRVVTLSLPPYHGGGPSPGRVVGQVSLLDPRSGRLLRTVTLAAPYGLSCDPRTGQILVGGAQGARVLDGRTGRLHGTLPTGPFQAMAVDAQTAQAVLLVERGVAPPADPWAWVPGWLRRRLPLLPAPPTSVHPVPGRVSLVNLSSP
jgi:hypothetical protein